MRSRHRFLLRSLLAITLVMTMGWVVPWGQTDSASTRTVDVNGRVMRVRSQGLAQRVPARPVVLLEAGAGSGLEAWDPVFARIAAIAPVVSYDRRGLGQSAADGQPQTLSHVTSSLKALLTTLKVPPPYVMVGQSYGGVLIRAYAQRHPNDVAGLVYLDVPDVDVTYAEADALPPGARQVIFNVPIIPPDAPAGLRAEMENIVQNIRTEFAEARAAIPPAHIPAAVVVGAGKSWPGATPEIAAALLRLQIKHQQEWALQTPHGMFITSKHLRHMVHQNDPELTVRVIEHVLGVAPAGK
jgi:pimeloyl-ACP methyl ester carboxylesterase